MKVLIYKRTHTGDPDDSGIFGIQDCMGRIRNWNYDAVIGIGGKSAWRDYAGIKYKLNWVGLEPKRISTTEKRGDLITFAHFKLYEEAGINIESIYPNLFQYMYKTNKRFDMSSDLPEEVFEEVKDILETMKNSPASKAYDMDNYYELKDYMKSIPCKCDGCSNSEKADPSNNKCATGNQRHGNPCSKKNK